METSFDFPEFADEAEQPAEAVELTAEQVELVVGNLDLVNAIAHIVYGKIGGIGSEVTVEDLIQQGSIGLIQAAKRYRPSSEASFQTFASRRIRGEMLDFVREAGPHSRSVQQKVKKWMVAWGSLRQELQREPTNEEIAAKIGFVDQEEIDEVRWAIASFAQTSLNGRVEGVDQEATELIQLLEDPGARFEERVLLEISMSEALKNTFLDPRERLAIERHFFEGMFLREVGESFNLTESRASQIVSKGLKKIRYANPDLSDAQRADDERRAA